MVEKRLTNPKSAEIKIIFGVLVVTPDVSPIRYCGGSLVISCGGGQLRILTENWRSFDRRHASFPRALGSSLLDGRGLAVLAGCGKSRSAVLPAQFVAYYCNPLISLEPNFGRKPVSSRFFQNVDFSQPASSNLGCYILLLLMLPIVADDCSEAAAEVEGKVKKTQEQVFLYCSSSRVV